VKGIEALSELWSVEVQSVKKRVVAVLSYGVPSMSLLDAIVDLALADDANVVDFSVKKLSVMVGRGRTAQGSSGIRLRLYKGRRSRSGGGGSAQCQ